MTERTVTVRSFAKINLDLRVLYKRPDHFHELRSVFQTISLADTIRIRYSTARRTRLAINGNIDIPDNLIIRAAAEVLDAARIHAHVKFELDKQIPMGAGLGGGSSNAAAVLLALPVLAGARIPLERLVQVGGELGSDVPFFLYGGTALGIGRGTELYPLPDVPVRNGVLVAPGLHVSTADAYRDLNRSVRESSPSGDGALTSAAGGRDTDDFRSLVWSLANARPGEAWKSLCANDFEPAVFKRHPALFAWKKRLAKLGASPALMTGSGSALFGLFRSSASARSAAAALAEKGPTGTRAITMTLLTRSRYRGAWRRVLAEHSNTDLQWPPQSRYSKP